jgi:radical SAM protein with 4Fe4S-binding SPASM domain
MKDINLNDIYVVNPMYKIRNDIKRARISCNNSFYRRFEDSLRDDINSDFSSILHPNFAYLFSYFNGEKSIGKIIHILSSELEETEEDILASFEKFINNQEEVPLFFENTIYGMAPKNFIVKKTNNLKVNVLDKPQIEKIMTEDFNFSTIRHFVPDKMSIMINNKCVVDCEYCYANKDVKVINPLTFERIKELINEASQLGMNDVEIGGGEFFLYPHWVELIDELFKHEYYPYISTKNPLSEKMVQTLKYKKITSVQLSIDTLDNSALKKMLNVGDNYLKQVKKGIEILNEAGIEIVVKPVITKYNDSIESIIDLLNYLNNFQMVKRVSITPGSHSIYKTFNYATTLKQIGIIENKIDEIRNQYDFFINVLGTDTEMSVANKEKTFYGRSLCSGNLSSFFVLPDGKVTICEQMYWHPFFILGDLTQSSIMEVWNGSKALSLWNFTKDEVSEKSPCKHCNEFEMCHKGRGNCWRLAIQAYGIENYDFPAPNCPKSLPVTRPYYVPKE